MNDDLVISKILKLLENNTAFIGYALNGGIGTKINVRNTETGKTIQALSINVDSSGEVLVVKDSEDNQYKAVTFKTAEKVTERIIQLRKTKPVDDKKVIEYTDSDIEVFYLFVKLIDTGSPVPTQLTSTWIRKGSSCTQFVGAYERCNYASKETIGGVSYTGLPYKPYETLQACLNDDTGRDAATPHGTKDENSGGFGIRIYSTQMTAAAEQNLLGALTSHDTYYGTNLKKLFGYGSILECGGGMYINGWEAGFDPAKEVHFIRCDFGYLPGFDNRCTREMELAGYCTANGGYISSKAPLFGQEEPDMPSVGAVDNSWGHQYGWINLPYEFMYRRHFIPLYVNGAGAQGSFLIISGLNDDQTPSIPPGYFPWTPGCPSGGTGGPYDGSGGNRFPDGVPPIKKRDMKLSTHKAEIWLGSSKKEEAIKLYELGASDLFSGMYNGFIIKSDETRVDIFNRLQRPQDITEDERFRHAKFYEHWNKNLIDLNLKPEVWVYTVDGIPKADTQFWHDTNINPQNYSLQTFVYNLYNRTLNLTVIDKKTQVVHLKLGLTPRNTLSNTDCKGNNSGSEKANLLYSSQSWEYQKLRTIKIKDWKIESTTNTLDLTDLESKDIWNKGNIERKYLTSFGGSNASIFRDSAPNLLLRHNPNIELSELLSGNHFEQFNYTKKRLHSQYTGALLYISFLTLRDLIRSSDLERRVGLGTTGWWELWDKSLYDKKAKRLNSIVGFETNNHQILTTSRILNSNNTNFGNSNNGITNEAYYQYFADRPLKYNPSVIKAVRTKLIDRHSLITREETLNNFGLSFFFSDWGTRWTAGSFYEYIDLPSGEMYKHYTPYLTYSHTNFIQGGVSTNRGNRRLDTQNWFNGIWTQLIYDGFVKVDVDSYKNVEFKLPTSPNQYIKYSTAHHNRDSEYTFTTQPLVDTDIETVLSPGTLDIAKQVKMTKPTNVDLDPNMSFLVYLYPFVEVTKKKKTI